MKITEPASFPELWAAMSKFDQSVLTHEILRDGHAGCNQTVKNWATGKSRPVTPSVRIGVAETVSRFLGIHVDARTLFA